MRLRAVVGTALISALAVVATDVALSSSLRRTFRPLVIAPADGATVAPPVVLRWDGPQPMAVRLHGGDAPEDLGMHQSPTEIDVQHFPRPGQYVIELRAPVIGRILSSERRFLVRPATPKKEPSERKREREIDTEDLRRRIDSLEGERLRNQSQIATLQQENAELRQDKIDLADDLADLREDQDEAENRLGVLESHNAELTRQYQDAVDANHALQARWESLPPCTAWGYLSVPRPQTVPVPRRVVVASSGSADVFRTPMHCEAARRADQTAVSACQCISTPFGN